MHLVTRPWSTLLAALVAPAAVVLALALVPAAAPAAAPSPTRAPDRDPLMALQDPLALERGPAPRVVSMVGTVVRFATGRTVRFVAPPEVTGAPRLIGTWRRDAVVWAPTEGRTATAYRIRPGGAVVAVGDPVLDLYAGGVQWQVAGDVLHTLTSDARFRSRLDARSLPTGRVLRQRTTTDGHLWSLLDATPSRAVLSEGTNLFDWRADGSIRVLHRGGSSGEAGDVRFASVEHDWFAIGTATGTELRRISRPARVVWKDGFENELIPFDISADGSVLLTTQYETYSPELRETGTGRVQRRYDGGYRDATNDDEMLVLEGDRAFLVVMNLRVDDRHREVLVRCTAGGECRRASRVAARISLQTY